MNKYKRIAIAVFAVIMLMVFVGCGANQIDWDSIKREDVVAEANGIQLTKKLVDMQYQIEYVSGQYSSSFFSQLGGTDEINLELSMDKSMNSLLAEMALASLAKDGGLTVSEEEAMEKAYNEYILSAKKYDYIAEYSNSIKQALYLSDDMLVEYGTQYNLISSSAREVVRAEFEKLNANDYEDLNAMSDAVLAIVKDMAKDVQVTVNYPSKHTVKGSSLDFSDIVTSAKWEYNSLFQ